MVSSKTNFSLLMTVLVAMCAGFGWTINLLRSIDAQISGLNVRVTVLEMKVK